MQFAERCVVVAEKLPRRRSGRWFSDQLLRCATSTGANYEEACAGESRADFLHKIQIGLKEVREARYWLALIELAGLMPVARLKLLRVEAHELVLILSKSVITAKRNRKDEQP